MSNQPNSGTNDAENADFHDESLQGIENVDTFAEGKRPAVSEEEMLERVKGDRKYVDPLSDFGFKKIFSRKNVMKAFLNDLLQPNTPIEQVTFLDKEKSGGQKSDRGVVYDLYCKTEDGSEFIVEMQNRYQPYFSDRIVYYLSRSIAPQGYKGKVNGQEWDYNLRPVYGIFFLDFHLNNLNPRMVRTIRFIVEETLEAFNDKVRAYTIELPGIEDSKPEDCKTNIEKWVYNLYNMNTMTKPLAFQDAMPVFEEVASAAEIAKMSADEYDSYITALDNYRTDLAVLKGARLEGRAEGKAEGLAEGKAEGKVEGRIEERLKNAKAMKAKGYAAEDIAEITGLSVAEIKKL